MPTPCPSDTELLAYAAAVAADEERSPSIEEHLKYCGDCRAQIRAMLLAQTGTHIARERLLARWPVAVILLTLVAVTAVFVFPRRGPNPVPIQPVERPGDSDVPQQDRSFDAGGDPSATDDRSATSEMESIGDPNIETPEPSVSDGGQQLLKSPSDRISVALRPEDIEYINEHLNNPAQLSLGLLELVRPSPRRFQEGAGREDLVDLLYRIHELRSNESKTSVLGPQELRDDDLRFVIFREMMVALLRIGRDKQDGPFVVGAELDDGIRLDKSNIETLHSWVSTSPSLLDAMRDKKFKPVQQAINSYARTRFVDHDASTSEDNPDAFHNRLAWLQVAGEIGSGSTSITVDGAVFDLESGRGWQTACAIAVVLDDLDIRWIVLNSLSDNE